MRWRWWVRAVSMPLAALGLVVGAVFAGQPVGAQSSDGNGLAESSVNTFRVDPDEGVVRVEIVISLGNVTTDRVEGNVIRRQFLSGYGVVVPSGAENVVATSSGGSVLDGELIVDEENDAFDYFEFDLASNLFSGQSTTVTVTYDHRGLPPRSDILWRANSAYNAFLAYGSGDSGDVTLVVVVPFGYEVDEFSESDGFDVDPDGPFGATVYTAADVDETFEAFFSISNDERLVETPVEVGGADFVIQSWPGDDEWISFTEDHLETGVPGLEALIGTEWPVEEEMAIRQTVEPAFAGYAGWFDSQASEIAVGEELDPDTVYHELSHAWFNGDSFEERWLIEGLAETYAAEMLRRTDGPIRSPIPVRADDPGRTPLYRWTVFDGREIEEYGYNASFFVVDEIAEEIGFDAMADVLAAGADGRLLYGDPDTSAARTTSPVDWQRAYDLFEIVGGATVHDALYREYVLPESVHDLLDERADARDDYDEFAAAAAPWSPPIGLRQDMGKWRFDLAATKIEQGEDVLALRTSVADVAEQTGVTPPDVARDAFETAGTDYDEATELLESQLSAGADLVVVQAEIAESAGGIGVTMPDLGGERYSDDVDDFNDATEIGDDQIDAIEVVGAAIASEEATSGFFATVGLYGADVDESLEAARAALERGDTDAARTHAADAEAVLADAADVGRSRTLMAGLALAGVLLLITIVTVLLVRRRRHRHRASAAGEGPADDDGEVGSEVLTSAGAVSASGLPESADGDHAASQAHEAP